MNKIYHLEIIYFNYEELSYKVLENDTVGIALIPSICFSNKIYKNGGILHAIKDGNEIDNYAFIKDETGYLHNVEVFVGE